MIQPYRVSLPQSADKGKSLDTKENETASMGVWTHTHPVFGNTHHICDFFLNRSFSLLLSFSFVWSIWLCLCVCICTSLGAIHVVFQDSSFLTWNSSLGIRWLASKPQRSDFIYLYAYEITSVPPHSAFVHGIWGGIQDLMLIQKHFYILHNLPTDCFLKCITHPSPYHNLAFTARSQTGPVKSNVKVGWSWESQDRLSISRAEHQQLPKGGSAGPALMANEPAVISILITFYF